MFTNDQRSFGSLDRERGGSVSLPDVGSEPEYPGPAWFRSVYNTPFSNFEIFDFAKACRHSVELEVIIPIVLGIVENSPFAGNLYDGELLIDLFKISLSFWFKHLQHVARLLSVINIVKESKFKSKDIDTDDLEHVRSEIEWFLKRYNVRRLENDLKRGMI